MQLLEKLTSVLGQGADFIADGQLLKNKIVESALKNDPVLLSLLATDEKLKSIFFKDIGSGLVVFDKDKLIKFVSSKEFLPDSYTAFKNKVGLSSNGEYLKADKSVALVWPYKDCVLEGGQSREDAKTNEIFWNETLASDETELLLKPKTLTNFRHFRKSGEEVLESREFKLQPTDNLIIKGNNLLALHSLKERFRGQIKLIYIDPPYNTGNDGFRYNDSFNHATWLTFMKNRLEIAKELLSEDGAIFVQIDYHEVAYLNVLMNEIFDRDNFVQMISVKTASPAGFKTVNPGPIDVSETILFYTKNKKLFPFKKQYVPVQYDGNYNLFISNIESEPTEWNLVPLRDVIYALNGIEVGKTSQQSAKNAKEKWGEHWEIIREQAIAQYALDNAHKVVSIRDPHKPTDKLKELLNSSKTTRNQIFVYERDDKSKGYVLNGGALSFYSNKVREVDGVKTPTELLTDFWSDLSWDGIAKEGGVTLKNAKKPERLLKRIIELATEEGDIVLDYHLGSGTTAAVAHKMGRQYIGVEQMDYIEDLVVERLKNTIIGEQGGISKAIKWKGGGSFVYCELNKLNAKYSDQIEIATSVKTLNDIMQNIFNDGYTNYKIDPNTFKANFDSLEDIEEKKRALLDVLDKNYLYVNYSEIDDVTNEISEQDKIFNTQFYGTSK